ncbi:MAG: hypothetical protein JJ863_16265 [Deltaproteobacteria bacterium]|nr:hypothetical protein [Deltaproteobacteria bacterium]
MSASAPTALGTLFWLVRRRVVGRFKRGVRRIRKSPRHLLMLLPILYPVVYFAFVFRDAPPSAGVTVTIPLFVLLALLAVLRPFFRADGAQAIAFTGDEVQWIATAPLSRPRLLAYAILRSGPPLLYFGVYWSVLMWITGVRAALPGMVVGLFLYGLTLTLLSMCAEMITALLAARGIGAIVRRIVLGGALLALIWFAAEPFRHEQPPQDFDAMLTWARTKLESSASYAVLRPFVFLASVPSATSLLEWLPRAGAIVALDAVLFLAIVAMPVPVEELALAGSRRVRRARSRLGLGGREAGPQRRSKRMAQRAGPALAPEGPAWRALLWMAFVGAWRRIRPSPLLLVLVGGALVAAIATDRQELAGIVALTMVLLLLFVSLMATAFTDPLRSTLSGLVTHLGTLRSWPVAQSTIARSFAIGGGLALSVSQSVLTLIALLLLGGLDPEWIVVSLSSAIAIVPVHVVLVAVRDAIAMTWPDMHRPAADLGAMRSANVVIGLLRALFFFAVLGLACLLGVGFGLALAYGVDAPLWLTHPLGALVGSVVSLLGGELFVRWSGRRLRFD